MRLSKGLPFFAVLVFCTTAAATLHLVWTHSPSPSVTNYRVYRGPSSNVYDWVQSAGNTNAFSLAGLPEGTFSFVVTAMDHVGLESLPSNTVELTNRRPAAPRLRQPQ